MSWDRRLWGVTLTSRTAAPTIIGATWDSSRPEQYAGEPPRALVSRTLLDARAWCQSKHDFYAKYPDGHVCREWRFRPIRVRERITKEPRA